MHTTMMTEGGYLRFNVEPVFFMLLLTNVEHPVFCVTVQEQL